MKQYIILGLCLLSLLAAGCSKEDMVDNENNTMDSKPITINAVISNGADTRLTYQLSDTGDIKLAWSTTEKFNLYQGTSNTATPFSKNGAGNAFKGYAPVGGSGDFYAVYGDNITNTNGKLTIDLYNQKGTTDENGITTFMVAESKEIPNTLSFSHKLAVLKLNLELPDTVTEKVNTISIMGLHNKAIYDLTKAEDNYIYRDEDVAVIKVNTTGFPIENNKLTAYVSVFPEKVKANSVIIKAETAHNLYYYILTKENNLIAGTMLSVTVTLAKLEHTYVDLDLPSHTQWATMNVGAVSPTDIGDHYAWGETETKNNYSWDSYAYKTNGLNDHIEGTQYDVAHVKWGENWQIPLAKHMQELIEYCDWQLDADAKSYKVKSRRDSTKYIFLPIAGHYEGSGHCHTLCGFYSSAQGRANLSNYLFFDDKNNINLVTNDFYSKRNAGFSVRPIFVQEINNETLPTIELNEEWK